MAEQSSRDWTRDKITGALQYLDDNYGIKDPTTPHAETARAFTGDLKADKWHEQMGLLDFTPAGAYFALEEASEAIKKAEPNPFKRNLALLSALKYPLQTILDKPEIGFPAIEGTVGMAEAIPVAKVITKPAMNWLKKLDLGALPKKTEVKQLGALPKDKIPKKDNRTDFQKDELFTNMGDDGALLEYEDLGFHLNEYMIRNDRTSLLNAFNSPNYEAYADAMRFNLKKAFPSGRIRVQRVENYADPGQGAGAIITPKDKQIISYKDVNIEDVKFIGGEEEAELIILDTPRANRKGAMVGDKQLLSYSISKHQPDNDLVTNLETTQ